MFLTVEHSILTGDREFLNREKFHLIAAESEFTFALGVLIPKIAKLRVRAILSHGEKWTHSPCSGSTNRSKKKRFGVGKIGIFGSFVRGEERTDSDVDVLVTFRKGQKTFETSMECKFYLEDLFGRRVDLVMKNTIKSRLKPYILGEVVYA